MPVTPFHFGPGGLLATASRRHISFLAFCGVNVLIDVESLRNMVTHQPRIHTFFHTYLGATLMAALTVLIFWMARRLTATLPELWVLSWRRLRLSAVVTGAALGAWSHVFLDSIMHADITPGAPFTSGNPMYQYISLEALHTSCLLAGLVALVWWNLSASGKSH